MLLTVKGAASDWVRPCHDQIAASLRTLRLLAAQQGHSIFLAYASPCCRRPRSHDSFVKKCVSSINFVPL